MENKHFPSHSFVICAYQDSPFLEECIKSLQAQVSVKKEKSKIILFTSTPSEFVEKLCKQYEIPMFTGKSQGIGANWNEALSNVDTSHATIAHQDDIYLPNYGELIIEEFEKNDELVLAFSNYQEIDASGEKRKRNLNLFIKNQGLRMLSAVKKTSSKYRILSLGNFICCPAVSFNLTKLQEKKFDENLKFVVDWDMWMRILQEKGQIKYLPQVLMGHRIHGDSETTKSTKTDVRVQEEYDFFKKYWSPLASKIILKFYVKNQKGNHSL